MRQDNLKPNKGTDDLTMEKNAYKELLDEIPDFIFFHDLDGRLLQVNKAVKTLAGLKEENLLGHKVPEFIHPKYRDEFSKYISEIIKKGEGSGTMVAIDSNNKTRILEYHTKVVKRYGVPIGVRGVARDISVQKKMERELEDRETLYRTLFENAEDAIFLMENDIFIDCNPKSLEIFACQKEDIVGKSPYFFSPEYQPDGIPSKEKALEKIASAMKGIPQRFEWQHKRLDGTPFDTVVNLYRIEVKKRFLLVAMVHDMSLQKKTTKALEESERKYREVVENTNVIILRYTSKGDITFINRFGEEFFGYKREELIGKRNVIGTILPATGENSEKQKAMFRDICTNPEKYHENENLNLTRDGREVFIAWRNQPIIDEEGNLKEILSIGADITMIKKLERELLQAKKLEAIGTLAGGIAHDFNNILGGMVGYLSLLKEQHAPEDPHYAILRKIELSTQQTSELVKQLLAFSRRGKFESKPVDMNGIIRNVLKILSRSISKKISIVTDLQGDLSMTEGDPSQLEQVIMNVSLNAAQAMPDGGELKITTTMIPFEDLPKDMFGYEHFDLYILTSISDTGIGMEKPIKEHIFEPFFTTKAMGKEAGTGLGLSTAYGIIRNHGGAIQVKSEVGEGTTFSIYLPAKYVSHQKEEIEEAKSDTAVQGKGKILVVDDEDVFREMMKDVLAYLGYDVLASENGQEGIQVYKEHQEEIDLVILDMNMPVMDGKEMFRILKKINPNVRALLATGFALDGEVQELMTEGVMGFIQKPFMIEDISKAIDALMKIEP
jgi:PAS domain S-box-containing protein